MAEAMLDPIKLAQALAEANRVQMELRKAQAKEIGQMLLQEQYVSPEVIVGLRKLGVDIPEQQLTFWDRIRLVVNPSALFGIVFKNWRTTVKGILMAVFAVLLSHGVSISDPVQELIIQTVGEVIGGMLLLKSMTDKDKKGSYSSLKKKV